MNAFRQRDRERISQTTRTPAGNVEKASKRGALFTVALPLPFLEFEKSNDPTNFRLRFSLFGEARVKVETRLRLRKLFLGELLPFS